MPRISLRQALGIQKINLLAPQGGVTNNGPKPGGMVVDDKGNVINRFYKPEKVTTDPYIRMRKSNEALSRWQRLNGPAVKCIPFLIYAMSNTLHDDIVFLSRALIKQYVTMIGGITVNSVYKGIRELVKAEILEDMRQYYSNGYRVDFEFMADGKFVQKVFYGQPRNIC